jgi:hypothetical protein
MLTLSCVFVIEDLLYELRALMTSVPTKHRKHGLYLSSRGFEARQLGQIGRLQQGVTKKS